MINSPIALLDDPDDPSLVALHLLNVLAVGSGLLPGNVERQSFSLKSFLLFGKKQSMLKIKLHYLGKQMSRPPEVSAELP